MTLHNTIVIADVMKSLHAEGMEFRYLIHYKINIEMADNFSFFKISAMTV